MVAAPGLAFTELLLEEIGLNLALDLLTVHQPSLSTILPCRVLLIKGLQSIKKKHSWKILTFRD